MWDCKSHLSTSPYLHDIEEMQEHLHFPHKMNENGIIQIRYQVHQNNLEWHQSFSFLPAS